MTSIFKYFSFFGYSLCVCGVLSACCECLKEVLCVYVRSRARVCVRGCMCVWVRACVSLAHSCAKGRRDASPDPRRAAERRLRPCRLDFTGVLSAPQVLFLPPSIVRCCLIVERPHLHCEYTFILLYIHLSKVLIYVMLASYLIPLSPNGFKNGFHFQIYFYTFLPLSTLVKIFSPRL